jgi:hypothetical protein
MQNVSHSECNQIAFLMLMGLNQELSLMMLHQQDPSAMLYHLIQASQSPSFRVMMKQSQL